MEAPKPTEKAMLLGLGLDNDDGHIRATRGEIFQIIGGSHETHQSMQEKCIKFSEKLKNRGQRLENLKKQEFLELAAECDMNVLKPRKEKEKEGE